MQQQFLTTAQTVTELQKRFDIRVRGDTVRKWCRVYGFGIRLRPKGPHHIPVSWLDDIARLSWETTVSRGSHQEAGAA
jgi:hypothetical protein